MVNELTSRLLESSNTERFDGADAPNPPRTRTSVRGSVCVEIGPESQPRLSQPSVEFYTAVSVCLLWVLVSQNVGRTAKNMGCRQL